MESKNDGSLIATDPIILLAFCGGFTMWTIIYYFFISPLCRFPGPFWSNLTRVPYWIACLKGDEIYFRQRLHNKYGSVVRLSPAELSYIDPRAWKDIYGHQKSRAENPIAPGFHLENTNAVSDIWPSMMVAGMADHARLRRLFSPGFSDRALKQQEPLFRKYVDLLISSLYETRNKPVDISKTFNLATFDIMAELTFGEPLGLLAKGSYTAWVRNITNTFKTLPILQLIKFYPCLNSIFECLEPITIRKSRIANFKYIADRVDKRLEKGSDLPDLWNMVRSAGESESLSLNEMRANAQIFMLAGTETTATLLTALTYLLLTNPETLHVLTEEVRNQAATAEGLTFETLACLKYLNACIQEALRIYPPLPLGIPRLIASNLNGGQVVCGKWVPSGIRVSVHPYAAYHSPANFRDPELFAPERWLHNEVYEDDQRDVLQPFSFGPRNCIGQNMAWHEMRLIMGTLVSRFDIELCKESKGWINGRVYVLWEKAPLHVRMRSVED